ncbi:phosphodiesterase [uncultured Pseudomonas sp.]|uniref:phosphodiesterase n=1 Tax=uncultured Pseudomonas sp. TaxID=114707 RepID=UPI002634D402|nr:phosphodiesterase [uncultured Pseudomonas sp.]
MPRLLALLALLMSFSVFAETLHIPVGQQGYGNVALPQFGESQRAVLERFGLADTEHPSVGNPPITRWDYREFSVYFEHSHVINSVRHHQPGAARPSKEQQ